NIFALFARRVEEREIAEFSEHASQFRLEDHQNSNRQHSHEVLQKKIEHVEPERPRQQRYSQEHGEANHDGPSSSAAEEHESVVEGDREDRHLQHEAPDRVYIPFHQFGYISNCSIIRTAFKVDVTSCVRMIET